MPSVSIIIPALNEAKELPRLFSSIKKQSLQPREVILADAGSTDTTSALAKKFGARVVKGGMPGVGRNAGARVATGDILLFLDADVELRKKDFLKKAVAEFERRSLDIASVRVVPLDATLWDKIGHKLYNVYIQLWGKRFAHASGFCIFVRRSLHEAMGGFDESVIFAEDHVYARAAAKRGRYGILHDAKIYVSVRRMDRDGRFVIAVKYVLSELYMLLVGPIRRNIFRYTFGHDGDDYVGRK